MEVGIEKAPENYKGVPGGLPDSEGCRKTPIVAGAKDGTAMAIFSIARP